MFEQCSIKIKLKFSKVEINNWEMLITQGNNFNFTLIFIKFDNKQWLCLKLINSWAKYGQIYKTCQKFSNIFFFCFAIVFNNLYY